MRRFVKAPSPALVISIIALIMASTGTAVAVVSFARNAGAVDHKSAVSSTASKGRAAGRLVATNRHGSRRGEIPNRFLDLAGYAKTSLLSSYMHGSGSAQAIGELAPTIDNSQGAQTPLVDNPSLGNLVVSCQDQNNTAGKVDPLAKITFTPVGTGDVQLARRFGNNNSDVRAVTVGTQYSFNVPSSDTFELNLQRGAVNETVEGAFRQTGAGTAQGACVMWGIALRLG